MKQYIVYKVEMPKEKSKSKALKVAAGQDGVSSVKIGGKEKDMVVVIGDEVDIVALAISLKSKVGYTRIVRVRVLDANDDEKESTHSWYDEGGRNQLAMTTATTDYHHWPSSTSSDYYYPSTSYPYFPHQPYPY